MEDHRDEQFRALKQILELGQADIRAGNFSDAFAFLESLEGADLLKSEHAKNSPRPKRTIRRGKKILIHAKPAIVRIAKTESAPGHKDVCFVDIGASA
ncbi:hypothetical protein [Paraburkholderia hospita]|uniref:hypothetical protein n=1 Tax=Paraburkholderia hospita TaxID=169430 RepID=UPI000B3468F5|nr:hypothetical protein [Paraburkholderia hospita]